MSLLCIPALGARGGFEGGWHPSVDVNAIGMIGKSKKCPLVLVEKSDGLCFGNVGEHRFCRASECKIRTHCWAEWESTCLAEDRQTTRKKP
jgi:hypothetical protein